MRSYSSKGILLAVGVLTACACFATLLDLLPPSETLSHNFVTELPAFRDLRWLELAELF